jgi:hypothetical protein
MQAAVTRGGSGSDSRSRIWEVEPARRGSIGPSERDRFGVGRGAFSTAATARALIGMLAVPIAPPAVAVAQEAPASASDAPQAADQNPGSGSEGDVLNRTRLFQLEYEVKTAPGRGPDGTIRTVTFDTFKLRGDTSVDLNSDWQLALRGDLPFVAKDPYNSGNPNADFLYGLGDTDVQAALIHEVNARWTAGFGARLIMPTDDDNHRSGKWQIMPIAGLGYALPEISPGSYVELLMHYDQSFAGNPSLKAVSNLQFAPMVNVSLPDRWFFTLYPEPDIRWNFGPPTTGQTGRLFLPFDGRIGRSFTKALNVSLEVGVPIVKQYPVYNFTTRLMINLNF